MSTKIQADEISAIIKERIDNFELNVDARETGKIVSFKEGYAKEYNLKLTLQNKLNNPRYINPFTSTHQNYPKKAGEPAP